MTNTPAVQSNGSAPAAFDDDMLLGLEDFDETDIIMPRIDIDHQAGVFIDTLSRQTFAELDCVVLGLVKNRVMWDKEVVENQPPLCQSLDFDHGRPSDKFPWNDQRVGFIKEDLPEGEQQILDCHSCPFKEWGSHPTRDVPWCSEAHTYVIAMPTPDGQSYSPAILTIKSSALTGSKAFLSSFVRDHTPTFVCKTKIGLDQRQKGSVKFAVPKFTRGEATDPAFFQSFAQQFRSTRSFLHTPRSLVADEDEVPMEAPPAAGPPPASAAAAPAPAAAAPAPAPAQPAPVVGDDDEMPF